MMVASISVKDQLTVQFSLLKLTVSLNCVFLKEQCHKDFAVLGQFSAKIITLRL